MKASIPIQPVSGSVPSPVGNAPPSVPCDLCGYGMPTPTVRNPDGSIPGLFVCSACAEDEAQSRIVQ